MPDQVIAGLKELEGHGMMSEVAVCVYQPAYFAPPDADLGMSPRLQELKAIFVTRRCSIFHTDHPVVKFEDGTEINRWARQKLPLWIKKRIQVGIKETLRIAGGKRNFSRRNGWYKA